MAAWEAAARVVDAQRGFDEGGYWERGDNPECERHVGRLLEAWRSHGGPVAFARHDSDDVASPSHPSNPGEGVEGGARRRAGPRGRQRVHSAFHGGPDLNAWLRDRGISGVAVRGAQTNVCCDTTARVAHDLGYDALLVVGAIHTFDLVAPNHQPYRTREITQITVLAQDGEFARVVYIDELVGR